MILLLVERCHAHVFSCGPVSGRDVPKTCRSQVETRLFIWKGHNDAGYLSNLLLDSLRRIFANEATEAKSVVVLRPVVRSQIYSATSLSDLLLYRELT